MQEMEEDVTVPPRRSKLRAFAVLLGLAISGISLAPIGLWILFDVGAVSILWAVAIWSVLIAAACYALIDKDRFGSNIALYSLWAFSILNFSGCARGLDALDRSTGGSGFF